MRELQIDSNVLAPTLNDSVSLLCWEAREILGAYMEEGLELDEWVDDADDSALIRGCDGDDLVVHETTAVLINDDQAVYLSNLPYTYDVNGRRHPLTEPGYVALRDMSIAEDPALDHSVHDEESYQMIFRVPAAGEHPAAIYEGWSLDEGNEIKLTQDRKLKQIGQVLQVVRFGLRGTVELNPDDYDAMYHSQAPRRSTGGMVEAALRDLFER